MKVYQFLARLGHEARIRDAQGDGDGWSERMGIAEMFIKNHAPSGSGFDCGTTLLSASEAKLVFSTEYHHMNDVGVYDGWTRHKIIIKASLIDHCGFDMKITGRDRNDIKDYIADLFTDFLTTDVEEYSRGQRFNFNTLTWFRAIKAEKQ